MTITFYNISDAPETVNKDVTTTIINASPKTLIIDKPMQLLTPEIMVDYDSSLMAANYAYISAPFNRYYFVNGLSADIGKTLRASLTVDPLMSFKTQLKKCPVTIIRSESSGVNYTPDALLPVDPQRVDIENIVFEGHSFGGSNSRFYLMGINATYAGGV